MFVFPLRTFMAVFNILHPFGQGKAHMARSALCGLRMQHGTDHGFLHAFDHRTEDDIHIILVKEADGLRLAAAVMAEPVGGGEGKGDLAAAVAADAARAGKTALCTLCSPAKLPCGKGRIRCDEDDDAALILLRLGLLYNKSSMASVRRKRQLGQIRILQKIIKSTMLKV